MAFIDKDELLVAIEEKYGELDNTCGCSVFTENGYVWLSVADIVDIINDCDTYEE